MKLAIIISDFLPTSEVFLLRQMRYFLSQSYETVDIYAFDLKDEQRRIQVDISDIEPNVIFFKALPKNKFNRLIQYIFYIMTWLILRPKFWKWGWPTFIGTLIQKSKRDKISTMLRAVKLADKKYDVVLCNYGPNAISILEIMKNCNFMGKLIAHFHGFDSTAAFNIPGYKEAINKVFDAASAIVAVSTFMKKKLASEGCSEEKISVIPCGAPVSSITPSDSVAKQPCKFIGVANMVAVKGQLYTLKAFHKMHCACPNATLILIGDGPLYEACKKFVENEQLESVVNLPGSKPNDFVLNELARASVFVQHNIKSENGAIEGWGVCFAEAAATGLPAIGTRHGGVTDIVIDQTTGYLVEEGNWQAMAEKMVKLANNPELRVQMGRAAREHIMKNGNCSIQLEKLDELIKMTACQMTLVPDKG